MNRPRVRLAPGTHAISGLARKGDWFLDGSYVTKSASERGIDCLPFWWPTALGGFEFWKPWLGKEPDLRDWEIPAVSVRELQQPSEVDPLHWPRPSRNHWIGHSHAAQPILIACAMGLRINVLVTCGSPIRVDVLTRYGQRARFNIGYHLHFWAPGDRTQAAGSIGDGYYGTMRAFNFTDKHGELIYRADENHVLPESAGHSGLLHDPQYREHLAIAFDRILSRDGRDDLMPIRAPGPRLTRG